LKAATSTALNELLAPIQKEYQASTEWQELALKAYPPPPKKEKKVKDKGTRHPKGKGADAASRPEGSLEAGVEKLNVA
jgi:tyrosyl-tRNA synthetase